MAKPPRRGNWGRWGPEDERGTANLMTSETVRKAASLVKTGRVYQLGLPIGGSRPPNSPNRPGVIHYMTLDGGDFAAQLRLPDDARVADDGIVMPTHSGTHIDALAHVWTENQLYNGHPANSVRSSGASRCGIDKVPPFVTRGVLLDVAAAFGDEVLPNGHVITAAELEMVSDKQGVSVEAGDVVLIRTGWLRAKGASADEFFSSQPGIGLEAGEWLAARDVVAVGADNSAVEAMSWAGKQYSPNLVHRLLIADCGIHLLELLDLSELSQDTVHEFLFVASPLRIKGGVGSPLNPVAIA
jgi:kynurenine formamidase